MKCQTPSVSACNSLLFFRCTSLTQGPTAYTGCAVSTHSVMTQSNALITETRGTIIRLASEILASKQRKKLLVSKIKETNKTHWTLILYNDKNSIFCRLVREIPLVVIITVKLLVTSTTRVIQWKSYEMWANLLFTIYWIEILFLTRSALIGDFSLSLHGIF